MLSAITCCRFPAHLLLETVYLFLLSIQTTKVSPHAVIMMPDSDIKRNPDVQRYNRGQKQDSIL